MKKNNTDSFVPKKNKTKSQKISPHGSFFGQKWYPESAKKSKHSK